MREYMEKSVKSALSRPLRGRYRPLLSIGVSALLSVSTFLTVIPQTETIIYADTSSKAIVLVDNGVASNIKNPTSGTWNRVCFGNYKQSSDGSGGFNEDPIKWRVLQNNTTDKTLFLLADQSLDVQQYNMRFESTSWAACTLHTWLNDTFMNSAFSDSREKQAIKETQVMTTGSVDTNDKIFLLSKDEVINNTYGFTNNTSAHDSRVSSKTDFVESINPTSSTGTNNWWLRSPGSRDGYVSMVLDQGNVSDFGFSVELGWDVRPAFNLNLSSIILTSAAVGSKDPATPGTLEAPGDYEGKEWKLTLHDSKMITGIGTAGVSRSGSTITVPYTVTGDNAGTANRISVLITDKAYTASDAMIKYYGNLAITGNIGDSGTGTFTLPTDYNTSWKVYILSEQINGDKKTDYASTPVEIIIPDINVPVTGVTVSPKETELKPGASQTLTHTIAPDNATNKNVTWSTSKPSVATVDNDGKVTAVDEGEAIITVTTVDGDFTDTCKVAVRKDAPGPTPTPTPTVTPTPTPTATPTPTPTPRPKWRPHHHDDDGADDVPSEPAKPAVVNPDTVEGFFTALGQPVPGVTMGRTVQGVAAQAVLNASRPAGYVQAFTFNMAVNGKVEYTLKNGVLTISIPKEFRKAGRTYAIMALDKNGKAVIFNDTDTNADTVTAAINVEGYAFSLIYKD